MREETLLHSDTEIKELKQDARNLARLLAGAISVLREATEMAYHEKAISAHAAAVKRIRAQKIVLVR